MSENVDAVAVVARLRQASRVLVASHSSPDGDAIGSALALAELLRALGPEAVVVSRDPAPAGLNELPGAAELVVTAELPADFPGGFDLVVLLECPDLDRPGFVGLDRCPIVNIDHHRSNARYGALDWLDETAPAVGEMVWRLYRAAGIAPSPAAATNCFVALSTDCGSFRYGNATAAAFRAAAEMVAAGADPAAVSELVHERRSAGSVRLLGEALATLELEAGGRLAVMVVGPDAFARAGASSADTEDIINAPRAIAGVRVVAFFKQWSGGPVRVSLRSKGSLDVCRVAAEFGGGGHTNAAGFACGGDLAVARQLVVARLLPLLPMEDEA